MTTLTPLVDAFGRRHTSLRISVTDRCNIRCFYCMPDENVVFRPRDELLTFEEIERFVRAVVAAGHQQAAAHRRRAAGAGRPARARAACSRRSPGIDDIALTTNGMLLDEQADGAARPPGLRRINISLDALREEVFQQISRRPGLDRVLAGIAAAQRVGLRADSAQRRRDPRHHRGRDRAAGRVRPRARPGAAVHRVHAARRRAALDRRRGAHRATRFAACSKREFGPLDAGRRARPQPAGGRLSLRRRPRRASASSTR